MHVTPDEHLALAGAMRRAARLNLRDALIARYMKTRIQLSIAVFLALLSTNLGLFR
jgi:hypothetical protein